MRERVKTELKYSDEMLSVASVLGRNMINPKHAEFVEPMVNGEDNSESESLRRTSLSSEWRLEAVIDRGGEGHLPGGGGVDMAPLKLPIRQVLRETRLQYTLQKDEMWRCSECSIGTYQTEWMTRHLVKQYGLNRPESTDHVLHVEGCFDKDRECIRHSGCGQSLNLILDLGLIEQNLSRSSLSEPDN